MRWRQALTILTGVACTALTAGALAAGPAGATAVARQADSTAAVAPLGLARQIPGLAALNEGGSAQVVQLSCASPAHCAAAGSYLDGFRMHQVWAAFEVDGTWQTATTIPNLNALNEGGNADVASLSCPEAGDCSIGGSFSDVRHNDIPWVADSVAGTWRNANGLLTASLNDIDTRTSESIGRLNSVSCASPGNCDAVLSMPFLVTGQNGHPNTIFPVAYLAADINGLWGTPLPATIITTATTQVPAELLSVSCGHVAPAAPVISCVASGTYSDPSGHEHAMVGFGSGSGSAPAPSDWGGFSDALTTPGTSLIAPSASGPASATATSCLPSGFCSWGGFYTDTQGHEQAFIASEDGGAAESTQTVPGILDLNRGGAAFVHDLSCSAPSNCAIAGSYEDSTPHGQAYVDAGTGTMWGNAQAIEGIANNPLASAVTVSCPAGGGCVAGGMFRDTAGHTQAFITNQNVIAGTRDFGSFFGAQEVAGNLNAGGNAGVTSVSCASGTDCAIGGFYTDATGHQQGFVVAQSTLTSTSVSASAGTVAAGNEQAVHFTVKVQAEAGDTPTGTVTVAAGSMTVCVVTLSGGSGTCAVPAGSLPPGDYPLAASYSGDQSHDGSATGTSGGSTFHVIPALLNTSTALAPSPAKVTFGREQSDHFTVTVTVTAPGQAGDTPTGKVTVKAGGTTIGSVTLKGGKGTRALAASQLRPGTYHLTAAYSGDLANNGSASGSTALTVAAEPTSTALTLSTAKVKFGHEQSARLTVAVKPQTSGTPAGKVTIKAGPATLCVITLKSAKGSCTLTASKLRPGSYQLTASYAAATPYAASTSPRKALTVTK